MTLPATKAALVEAGYQFGNAAYCSGCKRIIEWWMKPARPPIPMDHMPTQDAPAVPHVATCPQAKQFRKERRNEVPR